MKGIGMPVKNKERLDANCHVLTDYRTDLSRGSGDDGMTFSFRCDRESGNLEALGHVAAENGTACYRPHDMVLAGNTAYVAETDSPNRSGCLWGCRGVEGSK